MYDVYVVGRDAAAEESLGAGDAVMTVRSIIIIIIIIIIAP